MGGWGEGSGGESEGGGMVCCQGGWVMAKSCACLCPAGGMREHIRVAAYGLLEVCCAVSREVSRERLPQGWEMRCECVPLDEL